MFAACVLANGRTWRVEARMHADGKKGCNNRPPSSGAQSICVLVSHLSACLSAAVLQFALWPRSRPPDTHQPQRSLLCLL